MRLPSLWTTLPLVCLVSAGALVAACGSDVEPRYGPPGGLENAKFPTPTSTTTSTGTDGGTPPPSDAGVTDGSTPQSCTVKFSTDIFPKMQPNGNWKCSTAGCHNVTNPIIDQNNAGTAYTSLTGYTIVGTGKPYVNPNSTDPAQSTIVCNMTTPSTCGAELMPKAGTGTPATTAEMTTITTWLQCGAPNN
jgi:hypothetical protein